MGKVIFNALWGIVSAAFFAGTAKFLGWDEAVRQTWGGMTSSSQLDAITFMIGGAAGMIMLVCSLIFRWDEKLTNVFAKQYDRTKLERLRDAVKLVRDEWMKFPGGVAEEQRDALMRELRLAADDFTADAKFGQSTMNIRATAILMHTFASVRYLECYGPVEQATRLMDHNRELQKTAFDFLEATKHLVIYER
jgi:hypothetical protein